MRQHNSVFDRELPEELAKQFAAVGLDRAPRTVGEWLKLTMKLLENGGFPTGLDAMCTPEHDRHAATFGGETHHFHCVLDTLLVPFVVDVKAPVIVRSQSPQSGEIIEVSLSRNDIEVSPGDAVMSFGIATDIGIEGSTGDAIDPAIEYELFCPYVNAFASWEEYERWADQTDVAITIGLSMVEGFALARALEGSPTVPSDSHQPSDVQERHHDR